MTTLPLDDARTYEMLTRGDSIGVFQFESEGMREALKRVRPDEFNDLVALNALYRPGRWTRYPSMPGQAQPRGNLLSRRATALDPRILQGRDPLPGAGDADLQGDRRLLGRQGRRLRKAIGKKNREAMAALKPEFVEGCRASGTSPEVIDLLWQTNEKSADYSFNKSHAACYGLIAYRTAWLKANHTAEYMAALISSVMSTKDKVPFFVARLRGDGHRDPAARRQPLRSRVHGRERQHSLRPRRGQGRRLSGGRGDQASSGGGRTASHRCGTSVSASIAAPSTRRRSRR